MRYESLKYALKYSRKNVDVGMHLFYGNFSNMHLYSTIKYSEHL
jgi:hypothetical protein